MDTTYTYVTSDGSHGDLRTDTLQASGIGEAAQIAYGRAEEDDRECVAVVSANDLLSALYHLKV